MASNRRLHVILLIMSMICVAVLPQFISRAQTNGVTLSIVIPEYMAGTFTPELFSRFETANPGVKVHPLTVSNEDFFFPSAAGAGIEKHLEAVKKYASSADVVFITSSRFSVEGTRAGYFLDLAPLASSDMALNETDFFPPVWQAFQWDKALWGLPISADVAILSYDPAAFDAAGLAYPNEKWTMDDLANAARKLTKSGNPPIPGFFANDPSLLFASLSGEPFYDPGILPNPPRLATPALEAQLTTWAHMIDKIGGEISSQDVYEQVPIRIDFSNALMDAPGQKARAGTLLPGGKAGLLVNGFAVSAGTQYPNQAYALAKFLTGDGVLASHLLDFTPARKSLVGIRRDTQPPYSQQIKAALDNGLAAALSPSALRYGDYLFKALDWMKSDPLDALAALQKAEAEANASLKTAAAQSGARSLVIPTPVPALAAEPGKITLKFKLLPEYTPLPNRDQWDRAIREFVSGDPQVGQILMDASIDTDGFDGYAQKYDCFFTPYNIISSIDPGVVLNLDPLMEADSSFDKQDFIGNALAQFQRADKTWGYPLQLRPQGLLYNSEIFAKAGMKPPAQNWTLSTFVETLKTLKGRVTDQAPFTFFMSDDNHLLMLIAASGGLPLDYRTNPPTLRFTESATVDAIRQVLDLTKRGYIKYQKLTGKLGVSGWNGPLTDPMYAANVSMFIDNARRGPYQWINYPQGSAFAPVSYGASAAYISAKTSNPEACYRWIRFIDHHPELLWSMPARRSSLDSAALQAQGPDMVALYKQIDRQITAPNAVFLPIGEDTTGPRTLYPQYWLYQAFDRYVLNGANLDSELKNAETLASGFQACTSAIPPASGLSSDETTSYFKQFDDCAFKLDPNLKSLFQGS